jgi:hypothetical protein
MIGIRPITHFSLIVVKGNGFVESVFPQRLFDYVDHPHEPVDFERENRGVPDNADSIAHRIEWHCALRDMPVHKIELETARNSIDDGRSRALEHFRQDWPWVRRRSLERKSSDCGN